MGAGCVQTRKVKSTSKFRKAKQTLPHAMFVCMFLKMTETTVFYRSVIVNSVENLPTPILVYAHDAGVLETGRLFGTEHLSRLCYYMSYWVTGWVSAPLNFYLFIFSLSLNCVVKLLTTWLGRYEPRLNSVRKRYLLNKIPYKKEWQNDNLAAFSFKL